MEAYLKKLCFEYQVEEKEVKELLARMAELVHYRFRYPAYIYYPAGRGQNRQIPVRR